MIKSTIFIVVLIFFCSCQCKDPIPCISPLQSKYERNKEYTFTYCNSDATSWNWVIVLGQGSILLEGRKPGSQSIVGESYIKYIDGGGRYDDFLTVEFLKRDDTYEIDLEVWNDCAIGGDGYGRKSFILEVD